MKKIAFTIITVVICICTAMPMPLLASEYSFASGADSMTVFGKATSYDAPIVPDPLTENVRRNKDAALFPPSYGVFSGDIPTDATSLYHNNLRQNSAGAVWSDDDATSSAATSIYGSTGGTPNTNVTIGMTDGILPPTSSVDIGIYHTEPLFYSDGTIGSLYIHKLKKTLKVYEGESLESMQMGIGHFAFTSAWDGNCGFAGHNRGTSAYFSFVKDLDIGDKITYTTKYGERTYAVYRKVQISETDYSGLSWSAENIISMITCVENDSTLRWLVQAREVK